MLQGEIATTVPATEMQPGRQRIQIQPPEKGEIQDLKDRVERDEQGRRFTIPAREVVPD